MLTGTAKEPAERFSFAMAVVLTPAVVGMELLRLIKASHVAGGAPVDLHGSLLTGLLGTVFSFIAGLVALKWLSSWLESGRWYLFGIYSLAAAAVVFYLHLRGF
jgi:undecaprenyl-diphosphatase